MASRRFESIDHPGSSPWTAVYGMALVSPIATCMLPVMILTLVGVLEGVRVIPQMFWAAGAALLIAGLWTSFKLRRVPAEIRIDDEWVRVLTVREVARDLPVSAKHVLDVRDYGSWANVAVGLATIEIERSRWPRYEELLASLEAARRGGSVVGEIEGGFS